MGDVEQIASLLRERNALDERICAIIPRPMTSGHLGRWIAARILGIELAVSAVEPGFAGRFTAEPLRGRTVNAKWYLKREGLSVYHAGAGKGEGEALRTDYLQGISRFSCRRETSTRATSTIIWRSFR